MTKFNNSQLANSFFFRGKKCIEDAKFLYTQRPSSMYEILLIHGIELLLKSYMLLKDQKIKKTHDYKAIYVDCIKHGTELKSAKLDWLINDLSKYFYKDSIAARYIEESRFILFPADDAFPILENDLIAPMDLLRRTNNAKG